MMVNLTFSNTASHIAGMRWGEPGCGQPTDRGAMRQGCRLGELAFPRQTNNVPYELAQEKLALPAPISTSMMTQTLWSTKCIAIDRLVLTKHDRGFWKQKGIRCADAFVSRASTCSYGTAFDGWPSNAAEGATRQC
jgi:hypothetical protein